MPADRRERIMLAVATQNRCRYCRAVHTALAKIAGLSRKEIADLSREAPERQPPVESTLSKEDLVVEYVRDLARRGFKGRNQELWEELARHFSSQEREVLESVAHVMNFANRFGNTFDAFLARVKGRCERQELPWIDLVLISAGFLMVLPVVGPVLGPLTLPHMEILLGT
jgi:AhpD family alkylhydroperoxidase